MAKKVANHVVRMGTLDDILEIQQVKLEKGS